MVVLAAEALTMALVELIDVPQYAPSALLDAGVLTVLVFPVLYLLFHRPLVRRLNDYRRLESRLRRSVEGHANLQRLISPAIDLVDSDALLYGVIDQTLPLLGADAAWITVPGRDADDRPRVVARRGVTDEFVAAEMASPLSGCPVCGPLLEGGEPPAGLRLLGECPRIPRATFAACGIRSHIGVLLSPAGDEHAILNIGWRDERTLSETDRTLFATVVHQIGIALHNAQLFHAEKHARHNAQVLRRASLAVARSLDPDTVIAALLDHLAELLPYDRARVMLLEGTSRLRVHSARTTASGVKLVEPRTESFELAENPVLKELLAGNRGMLIGDTHRHAVWRDRSRPERDRSWLGVPLVAGGTVLGLYSLSKAPPDFFTQEHLELAEGLAAPASIAIHNAILFDEVRRSRVLLQTLSRQLVELQETERRAVARELHDEAGQALTTMKVGLRLLEQDAGRPKAVVARTKELRDIADAVQENLHRLAADLRPANLDHLGLVPALRHYLEEVSRRSTELVEFEALGFGADRISPQREIALFRIVQEAVNNALRHAQAERVIVLVERRDGRVVVIIEDDGVGFDPDEVAHGHQLGILGMRERTEMFGGRLMVESAPGRGTTIVAEVPDEE